MTAMAKNRKLELTDLVSVGRATVRDFELLGIKSVEQLRGKNADILFHELCRRTQVTHDPCVIDVFSAAIAQAENPDLPDEMKKWWYWSRLRKKIKFEYTHRARENIRKIKKS